MTLTVLFYGCPLNIPTISQLLIELKLTSVKMVYINTHC